MFEIFKDAKFTQFRRPAITTWNRLEGRARAEDFDRALKAEVRDALWMISKQWQMGEFIGDDAGSPILAKVHLETTQLNKYKAVNGEATALEDDIPVEVKVENQPIPFQQGEVKIGMDVRLLMGRQWLKLISPIDPILKQGYLAKYPVTRPDVTSQSDAKITAHVDVWQQFSAVAGRAMDGYSFYEFITAAALPPAWTDIAGVTDAMKPDIENAAQDFIAWYRRLFYQPEATGNPSWRPPYLEHQFSFSAPVKGSEKVLFADEYFHGHLDWYNFDMDQGQAGLGDVDDPAVDLESSITHTFVPTLNSFGGMPHPRWWRFEDWQTDLSFVKPDTTDLNKLLLLDFVLVYANDWFLVPFTLPVGSLADIKGVMVRNVFGENTWVKAAGSGSDEDWQRWNMYSLNIRGSEDVSADLSLVVLPAARKVLEGKPVEEVFLLRDEISNMVWGVETTVPVATGKGKPGRQIGLELKDKLQQLLVGGDPPVVPVENEAKIQYQLVNSVPEQWIPFIPVHIAGSNREIQLQRAAMPRILEGDNKPPKKVEPRTSLLREGLEQQPKTQYFLHEEEVPRAGIRIRKSFQRTRWYDGKVYNWLGIQKQTGRGEGASGLAFDQINPVKKKKE